MIRPGTLSAHRPAARTPAWPTGRRCSPIRDGAERARRVLRLQQIEQRYDAVPVDAAAARSYGLIFAAVRRAGRSSRSRFADLLIAAVGHANRMPLYTPQHRRFRGPRGTRGHPQGLIRQPRRTARLSPGGLTGIPAMPQQPSVARRERPLGSLRRPRVRLLPPRRTRPKPRQGPRFRFRRRPASPVRRSRRTRSTVAGAMLGQRSADLRPVPAATGAGNLRRSCSAGRSRPPATRPARGVLSGSGASTATGRPRPVTPSTNAFASRDLAEVNSEPDLDAQVLPAAYG